ncbi:MAG: helix-hairpin-helix domain-containing protein [bacterium]|nr:helix-hairpin-helix domain-containing protein [bacterium]
MTNERIAKIFREIANLLDIKGDSLYRIKAYNRAADILEQMKEDISEIKGKVSGIGASTREKIDEYLKKGKIGYYDKLKEETAIRQVVTHYFETKGLALSELKQSARKRKIIYSRYTRPAKELIELAGSTKKAKEAITKVAGWAKSRKLDYAIETVFKKWLELDQLKPKEVVKKPFYNNRPMIWSEGKKKWYVISKEGEWLEFADKKDKIEWKIQE